MASDRTFLNTDYQHPLKIHPIIIIISLTYSPEQISVIILILLTVYHMPSSVLDRISTVEDVHKSPPYPWADVNHGMGYGVALQWGMGHGPWRKPHCGAWAIALLHSGDTLNFGRSTSRHEQTKLVEK